jgi:UDP:flavonoid glycosyltransferase YjiC (YdhE family)
VLREALERLLGDPQLRRALGSAARSSAQERWAPQAAASALRDAYAAAGG